MSRATGPERGLTRAPKVRTVAGVKIISDQHDLDELTAALGREIGPGGVLVPTMGALHAGHSALIEHGAAIARSRSLEPGCIVSIFINPTQFNDSADLARYPRTLKSDLALCRGSGASIVFVPDTQTMYPPPPAAPVAAPPLPEVATLPGLEDAHRPGHFEGVCQVVMRLFELLRPQAAIFGEKDWQQLQVVRAMMLNARVQVEIIAYPTVRDTDGVAMSSRNRFLSRDAREQARAIARALEESSRFTAPNQAEQAMRRMLEEAGLEVDYAAVRDAVSLGPVSPGQPARSLIAARSGSVRLIDNAPWTGRTRAPHSSVKV
jgi:pantoate--beta-alanine ligase